MSDKIHIPLYKKILILTVFVIAVNISVPIIIITTIITSIVALLYKEK